jgi:hypothetical protein
MIAVSHAAARPSALVDLARYPIDRPGTPAYRALVERCRRSIADSALVALPAFATPDGVARLAAEADGLQSQAHFRAYAYSAYSGPEDTSLPPEHPRRRRHPSVHGTIPYDRFPPDSPLRAIYEWDALTRFLGDVLGERIYRCADPLLSLAVTVIAPGGEHAWHFDSNDFVVSLLLQPAERGGAFEYAPMIRDDEHENYDAVARLFDGDRSRLVTVPIEPGTLVLFKGRHSIHHVTRVEGRRARLIALLSYDRRPDMVFPDSTYRAVLGAAADTVAAHAIRA